MEDYLRSVQSRLGAGESDVLRVHAVLGGPEADVDTVASTLSLALHLNQREAAGGVCVPVLCVCGGDTALPGETVSYLQRVRVCQSLLLWREDLDLLKLHHTGKLSLTLLREGLLDGSGYHTLESSVRRVVAGGEGASSSVAVTTVAREILQEAAEHVRAVLGETLGEALRLQSETLWIKHGRRSVELEALMSSLEQWSDVAAGQHHHEAKLQELEQLLTKELKEFSDGEMTIALASLTMDVEDWDGYVGELKSFSHHHGYEGLVMVSVSDTVHHLSQQVAVYSDNTDILNQICCELEESSIWSFSGELEAGEGSSGCLQVYHLPINTSPLSGTPPLLEQEIQGLLKEFVDRRRSVLACHPSSRTSSTEGVAGSVEFSQGSSGITDMYGSDIERAEGGGGDVAAIARVMADGDEDSGGVGVGAGGELVSPDSGMATIRSSRSSKESSVFLSDDSPIGEVVPGGGAAAGPGGLFLRNPSPLGFPSLSPPVPPERRRQQRSSRNKSDNFDLFSFDPLHSSNHPLPAGGALGRIGGRADEGGRRAESSSLSEFEELSMVDFSAPNSLVGLDGGNSSHDHQQCHGVNEMIDNVVPPTPVNSLVGSCPPSSCGVRFFPEDVVERISGLQLKESVSSSLSEAWDELGFDTQEELSSDDAKMYNLSEDGGSQSLQNIVVGVRDKGTIEELREGEHLKSKSNHQRDITLKPQLSLITEHMESYDNWNSDSGFREPWNPASVADLQLTPPDEELSGKCRPSIIAVKDKTSSVSRKKELLSTLTPDTSKEEDDGVQGRKGDQQMELLDFWTYSAQKGFLKSDSATTTSYPESLDMWNMTIRDDSLSPLTTPDNLSDHSDSFCGRTPKGGGDASLESPPGLSDGGMEMWNTTIQEDSSSNMTTPEGPETGSLGHVGSWDASNAGKQVMKETVVGEERSKSKSLSQTLEAMGWSGRGNEHIVKIVIEGEEGRTWTEEMGNDDAKNVQSQLSQSEDPQDQTCPYQGIDSLAMPVPYMVTSTSEYDNVGAGTWSLSSSPETYASPVVDMIQLEGQSSPFIAVVDTCEGHDQYQKPDAQGVGNYKAVIADNEQSGSQVFRFEETKLGHMSVGSSIESEGDKVGERSEDWKEQPSGSPFLLVGHSSVSQPSSANHHSGPGEAAVTQTQTDQSLSPSLVNIDILPIYSLEHGVSQSACNDGPAVESQGDPLLEGNITDPMSFSPSSGGGERDGLKYSPDSLHPGSRDDLRSNSDGDSSSGLEMDYIIVSGTVKDTERERKDTSKLREGDGGRQARGTERSMETYNMLSCAATLLQAQASRTKHPDSTDTDETLCLPPSSHQSAVEECSPSPPFIGSMHCPTRVSDDASQHHVLPEIIYPHQSNTEALHLSDSWPTGCSQSQLEQGNYDDQSSIVARSVSSSLRYPSDHFLKTREEVYVHSQISMEDSDEGGQSPSAPPPCHPSLGGLQVWSGQLGGQDIPQAESQSQSPILTNSSISHNSSLIGTPVSESGHSTERGLGLPFSGDLMEDEDDDEEEEIGSEHSALPNWTSGVDREKQDIDHIERAHLGASDLLTATEKLIGACSSQQNDLETTRDRFPQSTVDYYGEEPIRVLGSDEWSAEQQIGAYEVDQESQLGRQDMTSHPSSQPTNENAQYQWTASQDLNACQTQYGYNYHHIDQRTENQSDNQICSDSKGPSQQNSTDVYAEFRTEARGARYESEQAGDEKYPADHGHYQFDGQPFYQSDTHHETEDHAPYMPEGYVHFLLSRPSEPGDHAEMMMMKMSPNEEGVNDMDYREDPPSSLDLSGESNQRRKLAAPPMNVSLERSEGSLLSDDALDTGDEGLDTGDDLDINIDELDTPDEADSLEFNRHGDSDPSGQGAGSGPHEAIPEYSAAEERRDSKLWRSVVIGEQEHRIDMKCIEQYQRVLSHGGYYGEQNAIIVFAACFLPDSDSDNYHYVMENLFLYVISTLELMVADDYMIVYLNGATPRRRMPGFSWMKKCYQMIDRRLKKNLKLFIIVHPSWFIRTVLGITRPFISSKFSSKIKYVHSLAELRGIIPMEYVHIPPSILKYEEERGLHKLACMRLDEELQETSAKAD